MIEKKYKCIILTRNNPSVQLSENFINLDIEGLSRIMFLSPNDFEKHFHKTVLFCVANVIKRKQDGIENHPTNSLDIYTLAALPLIFANLLKIYPGAYKFSYLKNYDFLLSDEKKVTSLIKKVSKATKKTISQKDFEDLDISNCFGHHDLNYFRRDPNDIKDECVHIITNVIENNCPPINSYLAVVLDSDSKRKLKESIVNYFPGENFPEKWNLSCDHVTLMHSSGYFSSIDSTTKWENIYKLIGKKVTICPISLAIGDNISAIGVNCYFNKNKCNDSSVDSLVQTEIPHITIALATGVPAKKSIELLSNPSISKMPISLAFDLEGEIQIKS